MFFSKSILALATFVASSTFVAAAPAVIVENIVYNPMITSPQEGDVWTVGETKKVTWSTDGMTDEEKDIDGMILLGYLEDDNTNEHLDIAHPLAEGFKLGDGNSSVVVPNVDDRDDYIVVLFGDSGNASKKFSITGGSPVSVTESFTTVPTSETLTLTPTPTSIAVTTSSISSLTATSTPATTL